MNDKRRIDLVSAYLLNPVLGVHRIGLTLEETDSAQFEGTASLDPNQCTLDLWGEPSGCTKMAIRSTTARALRMRTWDLHGHDRVHHVLTLGENSASSGPIHLIEYAKADLWYLVVDGGHHGTSVVPLFASEIFHDNPIGAMQTRYGVPLREIAARGDLAEMKAEAEAVRHALTRIDAGASTPELSRSLAEGHVSDVRAALAELDAAIAKVGG
jgi:hypothetical protein